MLLKSRYDRLERDGLTSSARFVGRRGRHEKAVDFAQAIRVRDRIDAARLLMENRTAKSGEHNSAMASYNFSWLWTELGISELRR
jgi:hypothetical protein